MGITHVIRGEEHVNGTPKYLLLADALGYDDPPVFAHLPLLVNEQRKKLSKRRDDVAVGDYRGRGFLPEAMRNYLALLGWGPPDGVEVRPIEEIIELFRLEDVTPSPAFFDLKKLRTSTPSGSGGSTRTTSSNGALEFAQDERPTRRAPALGPTRTVRVKVAGPVARVLRLGRRPGRRSPLVGQGDEAAARRSTHSMGSSPRTKTRLGSPRSCTPDSSRWPSAWGEPGENWTARYASSLTGRLVGLPLFDVPEYLGRDRPSRACGRGKARLG